MSKNDMRALIDKSEGVERRELGNVQKNKYESKHVYEKTDLIGRLDACLGKTFEEIDTKGVFSRVKEFNFQKGIAGTVVEQCIFEYSPDNKQEADLVVIDKDEEIKTELKTTGMVMDLNPKKHFVAKEPMSITAVGIYDIANQEFWTSHFWEKLEHMLIVYYHYLAKSAVTAYEYRTFQLKGYEFHSFTEEETRTLKRDWEYVRDLCRQVVSHHPGPETREWRAAVKQEYIDVHGQLRKQLSFIDLAPKFPPRFRLKKPTVSAIISKHFGYEFEQLPGRYTEVSDIDKKCHELTKMYSGWTIRELAKLFGISIVDKREENKKGIAETIVVAMFGGKSKKMNRVELFQKFGFVAKTITLTSRGGRTEDMKLFHMDFDEIMREEVLDEEGGKREYMFEDSELYSYFAEHEFLCIIFEESERSLGLQGRSYSLCENKFVGFKRLVFEEEIIDGAVKRLWEDTRCKIKHDMLEDVVQRKKNGTVVTNTNGEVSSAPNFLKSSQNDVFMRGSATDSSLIYKTECVNGIRMLPQYVWLKGKKVVEMLKEIPII